MTYFARDAAPEVGMKVDLVVNLFIDDFTYGPFTVSEPWNGMVRLDGENGQFAILTVPDGKISSGEAQIITGSDDLLAAVRREQANSGGGAAGLDTGGGRGHR
ncbi:MAG: hypothetical protein RDU30_09725 [Desulfovibrionaceae bacterium]|nr:hypothetical protein [Desulfovibrionaceae bacterium]